MHAYLEVGGAGKGVSDVKDYLVGPGELCSTPYMQAYLKFGGAGKEVRGRG